MKIIILLILCVAVFLFLAETTISFNPFRISLAKPYLAIGWIIICIGIAFIEYQGERTGKEKVYKAIDEVINSQEVSPKK